MEFRKYQHLERFGTPEVEGIENGEVYIFPKLDGTNSSIWLGDDGVIRAGSRNRELTLDNDNAGFLAWVLEQDMFKEYFSVFPEHRLFGEWLVPHTLKTYREDAWRRFYVFDVAVDYVPSDNDTEYISDSMLYLHFDSYEVGLMLLGLDYIRPLAVLTNGDSANFDAFLEKNTYLINDGSGFGEGIVMKQYHWRNKYGRCTWAKMVANEFREKHDKNNTTAKIAYYPTEQKIIDEYITVAFCDKTIAKIGLKYGGFRSKNIPELLNTVFHELITEESWNFIKKFKYPTVNFKRLNQLCIKRIRENLPQYF